MSRWRRAVAEALGTGLLLAVVVGSGIMAERLAGGNVALALLANAIATGAGLIALILMFGAVSGAHLNPAVSLGLVLAGVGSGSPPDQRAAFMEQTAKLADLIEAKGAEGLVDAMAEGPTRIHLQNKDPRGFEEFRRNLGEHPALGSAYTMRNYQGQRPSLTDFTAELAAMTLPVLIAVGDEDAVIVKEQRVVPDPSLSGGAGRNEVVADRVPDLRAAPSWPNTVAADDQHPPIRQARDRVAIAPSARCTPRTSAWPARSVVRRCGPAGPTPRFACIRRASVNSCRAGRAASPPAPVVLSSDRAAGDPCSWTACMAIVIAPGLVPPLGLCGCSALAMARTAPFGRFGSPHEESYFVGPSPRTRDSSGSGCKKHLASEPALRSQSLRAG